MILHLLILMGFLLVTGFRFKVQGTEGCLGILQQFCTAEHIEQHLRDFAAVYL